MQDMWNERHKEDQYTTWKGTKRAYDLVKRKLDTSYRTTEVREDETN